MSENNLVLMEVLNLYIYDGDELLFSVETMKEWNIRRDFDNNHATLFVKDAVVDTDLMNMVLGGKLDKKALTIKGVSKCVDKDGNESDTRLDIQICKLVNYWMGTHGGYSNRVTMIFDMPIYVNEFTREQNGTFSILKSIK